MRRPTVLLLVMLLVIASLVAFAAPASAIVHAFTPVDECAASGDAGGVRALGPNPVVPPGPVPVTASEGRVSGDGGDSAPVQC
jgi:hypothetical protein